MDFPIDSMVDLSIAMLVYQRVEGFYDFPPNVPTGSGTEITGLSTSIKNLRPATKKGPLRPVVVCFQCLGDANIVETYGVPSGELT